MSKSCVFCEKLETDENTFAEADLMKLAMIEVDKRLDGRGEQLLQIHDSILIECPKEHAEAISEMLVDTMENIYPNLGVRLQVDVHTGDNWGEV